MKNLTLMALLALMVAVSPLASPALAQEQQGEHTEVVTGLDRSVLADETRPESEIAQDEYRKALEVYEFFGIKPGLTVADVYPGTGYNTHLLSRLMGDQTVYSILRFYDGFTLDPEVETFDVRLKQRVEEKNLDNVVVVTEFSEVPENSVDVAIMVRNYHDLGHYFEDISPREELSRLYPMIKPGGIVGVVEVATDKPGWDEATHRLNKSVVIEDFTAAGFELVSESDLLANPDDDYSTPGFQEGRYTMDRYVLKFRKPVGETTTS